jgi:hypothetical protein
MKHRLTAGYFIIAFMVSFFFKSCSNTSNHSYFFNLGKALVWPISLMEELSSFSFKTNFEINSEENCHAVGYSKSYCSCVYDSLEDHYSSSELEKFYESKKVLPDDFSLIETRAMQECHAKDGEQVNSNTDLSQLGGEVETADQANAAYSAKVTPAPAATSATPVPAVTTAPVPASVSTTLATTIPSATPAPTVASEPQVTAASTAPTATSTASASNRVVKCQIDSNGSPSYKGQCLFGLDKGGSFSLQNVNKVSPIAGVMIVSVYIEGKGIATVSDLTKDGLNSRWGEAQRSSKDKACWVGSDFKVCAW